MSVVSRDVGAYYAPAEGGLIALVVPSCVGSAE